MQARLRQQPFFSSIVLNTLLFGLCLSWLQTRFGTTDDLEMQMVLAGQNLVPEASANLRWTHLFIGAPLAALYRLVPSGPWYGLYLTLAHWLGMVCILYSVLLHHASKFRVGIFILFFLTAEVLLLQELQYTSSALVLGTGAVFLLFTAISKPEDKRHRSWWWSAAALLLFVAMMRWDAFLLVVILGTPLLLYAIVEEKTQVLRHLVYCTGILVAAWGVEQTHYLIQNQDPAWKHYNEYKHSLAAHDILDYRKPQYVWSAATADDYFYRVGWEYADLRLFQHWFFADSTVYGLRQFKTMQAAFQNRPYGQAHLQERTWKFFVGETWADYVFYGFLFLLIALLAIKGTRNWYLLLAVQLALAVSILYYLYVFKHLPERVSFPLAFYLMGLGALFALGNTLERLTKVKLLIAISLLAVSNLKLAVNRSAQVATEKQQWSSELDTLNAQPEELYIGGGDFYLQFVMTPYQSLTDTLLEGFNLLDFGHFANSPNHYRQLEHFGIDNIHTHAPLDSNVYFVHRYNASIIPWYISFVERHYNRYIELELVRRAPTVNAAVYRIREQIREAPNSQGISIANQEAFGIPRVDPDAFVPDTSKPLLNINSKDPFPLQPY